MDACFGFTRKACAGVSVSEPFHQKLWLDLPESLPSGDDDENDASVLVSLFHYL